MDLIKDDFGDLTDAGLTNDWPEFVIEWLHESHLAGQPINGIIFNRLRFRDKGAIRKIIQSEYIRRGVPDEFDATWARYKNAETARTPVPGSDRTLVQTIKPEPTFHFSEFTPNTH